MIAVSIKNYVTMMLKFLNALKTTETAERAQHQWSLIASTCNLNKTHVWEDWEVMIERWQNNIVMVNWLWIVVVMKKWWQGHSNTFRRWCQQIKKATRRLLWSYSSATEKHCWYIITLLLILIIQYDKESIQYHQRNFLQL